MRIGKILKKRHVMIFASVVVAVMLFAITMFIILNHGSRTELFNNTTVAPCIQRDKSNMENKTVDQEFPLNEKRATEIAESLFVNEYGIGIIEQRPWIVTDNGDAYTVSGTFHGDSTKRGGVAHLIVKKNNGEVLRIYHTR